MCVSGQSQLFEQQDSHIVLARQRNMQHRASSSASDSGSHGGRTTIQKPATLFIISNTYFDTISRVAVPIPSPVAALAVPLREYSEFSVRYFALQRLLLVCPVLARNQPPQCRLTETQSMIVLGTISSHSYPPEPL